MILDAERLEGIRVILMGDEGKSYSFYEKGKDSKDASWYVGGAGLSFFKDEDSQSLSEEQLLNNVKGKELVGQIFLGWSDHKEVYKEYTDWEQFAKVIGISEMITMSVKIPKNVARRFKVFAEEEATSADIMRKLICGYVIKKVKENADSLIFKDAI